MPGNTLTRLDLSDVVHEALGVSRQESMKMVDAVFDCITNALLEPHTDMVKIARFGTFFKRQKKQRLGRNPKTKEEAIIDARTVVGFHASNVVKHAINAQHHGESVQDYDEA